MAPHSSYSTHVELEDAIEIQHVDGRHTPIVRLGPSSGDRSTAAGGGGAANQGNGNEAGLILTLSQDSAEKIRHLQQVLQQDQEDVDDTVEGHINVSDSDDQDTIFDTFSSMCLPLCAPGCYVPPKSALKKPGQTNHAGIQSNRSVSFNSLTVREYDLTLGDHPSSASGPPVQLDWEHKTESVVDLNTYEQERQPRKTRRQLKMSFTEREEILQSKGYSMEELKNAWMESLKIRQQRYETIMTGSLTSKVEEAWESACRKFNRLFTLTTDMEGYEVKAEETGGAREAFSYVKKSEEDEFGIADATAASSAAPPTTWSFFDSGDSPDKGGCGSTSGASLSSWFAPCTTGSTRTVVS